MRTVVLGPRPAELDALIARRKALGLDTFDEVWEGEYHMAPAANVAHGQVDEEVTVLLRPLARSAGLVGTGPFNLGRPDDFRVPDHGYHRGRPVGDFLPTAAIVVEILSPHDETWRKLDFYAAHHADELLIVSPKARTVTWLALRDGRYVEVDHSRLLGERSRDLADSIDWPEIPRG
ncbi:MAG: Uma2 family endonuclease [Acidimicrobiales bacterium]